METSLKRSEKMEPRPAKRSTDSTSKTARSKNGFGAAVATLAMLFSIGIAAPAATAAVSTEDSSYDLTVNGQALTLREGQTITVDLYSAQSKTGPGNIRPSVVYPNTGGTITVTASSGNYYWSVSAPCAISFLGTFSITDLTSGLGGGTVLASGFSGSAPTSKLHGHRYSGTLSGTASSFWGACAWTGPNNTLYTYP